MWYLGTVVLATIMLYYELYISGAVATNIIAGFGMTFKYYVYISVVSNAVGAFGSLLAGLSDRWGRANLVAYGLVITALLALFGIPNAHDKWTFAILTVIIGLVEGVILVATPALIRDFSPQLGRASAMGSWTLGLNVGSASWSPSSPVTPSTTSAHGKTSTSSWASSASSSPSSRCSGSGNCRRSYATS